MDNFMSKSLAQWDDFLFWARYKWHPGLPLGLAYLGLARTRVWIKNVVPRNWDPRELS